MNIISLKKNFKQRGFSKAGVINVKEGIETLIDPIYRLRPFWEEYGPLLKAVKVEKRTLTMILQIIVVVAIFNVVSFLIYINERRAKNIFLLQALGMKQSQFVQGWTIFLLGLWVLGCLLSVGLTEIFKIAMANLSFLKLPGDIYSLSRIPVRLDLWDYTLAFTGALFWLFFVSFLLFFKAKKRSLISYLRLEFN